VNIDLLDYLQWAWGLVAGGFWLLWREIKSVRGSQASSNRVMGEYITRIAVLEATQKNTSECLAKIEGHLERIERKIDAKADK